MTREFVGRPGIMSLVEWSGAPEEGRPVLTRIREELQPAVSDLSVVPFLFIQTITDDLFAHGLRILNNGEVACCWRYASMDDAVRALLCSAGGARAIQAAGEPAVREVLQRTLAQFQDPQTSIVTLQNTFRWVAARR